MNQVVPITQFAEPGGFNNLDLLEVGNSGLTTDEQQTHFAFWAATKSPLIISTDLTAASSTTLNILKIMRVVVVNDRDLLFEGYPVSLLGFKARKTNTVEILNPAAYAPDFWRMGIEVEPKQYSMRDVYSLSFLVCRFAR
ncbi:Alpha-galactosidase [Mycena chlorophos]|uniref:Alpha-galactosidase n=1 Tax=Mycena chlorophos TaxID=658473 RepID=A0A8H6TPY4_MYCCL|nr:Alpha-galactosidase [Mycena chlorophos]